MVGLIWVVRFSVVFQWGGDDLISDLISRNKKILNLYFIIAHGLTPHAKFQNPLINCWS